MKAIFASLLLVVMSCCPLFTQSFVAKAAVPTTFGRTRILVNGFLGEPEREKLTRDDEPEDFFST
jgi:hypothetical protein